MVPKKKICMLGGFAVGKTSLVKRFVTGQFSEKYHTSIGVKIDQKSVHINGQELLLVLWDLYGDDDYQKVRASYLHGSSGYLLVIDGTRSETLSVAQELQTLVEQSIGPVPFVLMANKCDLQNAWEIEPHMYDELAQKACMTITTSAKTGEGVESAFLSLANRL